MNRLPGETRKQEYVRLVKELGKENAEEQLAVEKENNRVYRLMAKQLKESQAKQAEMLKFIYAHEKAERDSVESLKNAKPTEVVKPKSIKRKKQLDELQMLKKEVENSKITDIKLDSSIEGMIIKLDALTKSKVLRKQIKDLLEEIEEFKVDGITGSEDIPKLLKKVEAQIKKTKNKKVVEELKALKKQVEETEFKELKEAKSYKEKHPESKAVKAAECPCGDSKEDLKACKKEVASLMRKLKKHTK